MDLPKLLTTQISLSEWFEKIGHRHTDKLRQEDNEKRDRLQVLHEVTGLPYDKPTKFAATELVEQSDRFRQFLKDHDTELCALRLIPTDSKLPKLRMRGLSVRKVMSWFAKQHIDPAKYRAEFIPHALLQTWATIFVVTGKGIFGEIVLGRHAELTQGFYGNNRPMQFSFDFKKWQLSNKDPHALAHLKKIMRWIRVDQPKDRAVLVKRIKAKFAKNYVCGYFETTAPKEFGIWFIDYNRLLAREIPGSLVKPSKERGAFQGVPASIGIAKGNVRLLTSTRLPAKALTKQDILVCPMTTPSHVPLMMKVGGIITEYGGILSHAAIVSRELKVPCITAVKNITKKLKTGIHIKMDGTLGTIEIL